MEEENNTANTAALDRSGVLKLIEQRRKAIEEKKKKNEELRKVLATKSAAHESTIRDSSGSSALLSELLDGVEIGKGVANSAAITTAHLSDDKTLRTQGSKELAPAMDFARNLKSCLGVGAALAVNRQFDVTILPLSIDRFNKTIQTDTQSLTPPEKDSPAPAAQRDSKISAEDIYKSHKKMGLSPFKSAVRAAVESAKRNPRSPDHASPLNINGATPAKLSTALSETEKKEIMTSQGFAEFFNRSTKMVERTLGYSENFDILVDYSGAIDSTDQHTTAETVKQLNTYSDSKWTIGRQVMDVRSSAEFNDLFLCAYGQKENAGPLDPDGCVVVWSLAMNKRPEFVFTCQSPICTALFDTFQPHTIIGGTFSGSVVLWDTRAKTRPVQRAALSSKAHLHPIYSMEIVGTEHAHNLVSVDTDGRLCLWSLSMLVHPTETIDLKKATKEPLVTVLCIGFPDSETNTFYGGTNDGSLFQAHIHGSKTGVTETYESGHSGPITSLHWHKSIDSQPLDYSDLVLTSSFDWTVKLWCPKLHPYPLHTFEIAEDYVLDSRWHPSHPGVFASANADGIVDFWDITHSIESPVIRKQASSTAISKLCWSHDGRKVMTGDNDGMSVLWGLSQDLTVAKPDDWSKMEKVVDELKSVDNRRQAEY